VYQIVSFNFYSALHGNGLVLIKRSKLALSSKYRYNPLRFFISWGALLFFDAGLRSKG